MLPISDAPLAVGTVTLAVENLPTVATFYREAVGLQELGGDASSVLLGVGDNVLLRLEGHESPIRADGAGLFHTAFLLPNRSDLGCWLRHADRLGLKLEGASDHGVSEAVYLSDPEGNGIEIYVDRPAPQWPRAHGVLQMTTGRLAVAEVIDAANGMRWTSAPTETRIGHIHLRVGSVDESERFYRDVVGLAVTVRYPAASFMSSGGYHHHVAVNEWHTAGMGRRDPNILGLGRYELCARDAATVDAIANRAAAAGVQLGRDGAVLSLKDPSGNRLEIAAPS